jgi:hypothetical protein
MNRREFLAKGYSGIGTAVIIGLAGCTLEGDEERESIAEEPEKAQKTQEPATENLSNLSPPYEVTELETEDIMQEHESYLRSVSSFSYNAEAIRGETDEQWTTTSRVNVKTGEIRTDRVFYLDGVKHQVEYYRNSKNELYYRWQEEGDISYGSETYCGGNTITDLIQRIQKRQEYHSISVVDVSNLVLSYSHAENNDGGVDFIYESKTWDGIPDDLKKYVHHGQHVGRVDEDVSLDEGKFYQKIAIRDVESSEDHFISSVSFEYVTNTPEYKTEGEIWYSRINSTSVEKPDWLPQAKQLVDEAAKCEEGSVTD